MTSYTSRKFWIAYHALPDGVKRLARQAYRRFRQNPAHPALHFKLVSPHQNIYSVRIGRSYRALGAMSKPGEIIWFWIGTHSQYDGLL